MLTEVGPIDGSKKNWLLYNFRIAKEAPAELAALPGGTALLYYDDEKVFWVRTDESLAGLKAELEASGRAGKWYIGAQVKVEAELREPLPGKS